MDDGRLRQSQGRHHQSDLGKRSQEDDGESAWRQHRGEGLLDLLAVAIELLDAVDVLQHVVDLLLLLLRDRGDLLRALGAGRR